MKDDSYTKVFREGVQQGMWIHSWMKNGVSYIGQQRPDGTGDYKLRDEQAKVVLGDFDTMLSYPENCYLDK